MQFRSQLVKPLGECRFINIFILRLGELHFKKDQNSNNDSGELGTVTSGDMALIGDV